MNKIIDFNDNELIYLIKNNNELANTLLIKKYEKYIHSKIHELHLLNHEDCFQEGLIVLFNAVKTYDEKYNKSFNKFFEHLLNNKLIDIKRIQERESNYFVIMDEYEIEYSHYICDSEPIRYFMEDTTWAKLTFMEKEIYHDYFEGHLSIDAIAIKQKTDKRIIYNAIYRIKKKIKKYMVK